MHTRRILYLCWVLLVPLTGCLEEGPPKGFKPQAASTPRYQNDMCPDLSGMAIAAEASPFVDEVAENPAPDTHGLPLRLAFQRGVSQLEAWWVVPRTDLKQFANDLLARNPAQYARWRELVLRGKLSGFRENNIEAYRTELALLGPPARRYAGIVSYGCKDHWALARRFQTQYVNGRTTERELWFARDKSGDLLIRDVTWRLKPFSVWGDATSYIRTGSSARWHRVRTEVVESVEALTDDELPPVPGEQGAAVEASPAQSVQPNETATTKTCQSALSLLETFSQRLRVSLPAGVEVSSFRPLRPGDRASAMITATDRGSCESVAVEVEIEGPAVWALDRLNAKLESGGDVRRVDVVQTTMNGARAQRRLLVVLQ